MSSYRSNQTNLPDKTVRMVTHHLPDNNPIRGCPGGGDGPPVMPEIRQDESCPVGQPWPLPELGSPPDVVLERLDQVLVVPMPKRARVVKYLTELCP